ncbi:MAG: perosamine synthetase [Rickettsiaceae bacterium 4572_127]|nr:MAG: perosamine synthetase [Rickettsiaceae bacterium 4572_127]
MKYPVYIPQIGDKEKQFVNEALDSTWISSKGKFITEFEEKFSKYLGIQYSASCTNGTVAIHLALLALGIKKGDEVIVPTFTYIASVNAIKYVGATPVFADCTKDDWQVSSESIKNKITEKTKAILTVPLYGCPCDMDEIKEIAKQHNLKIIEDCAEAIGSEYNGEKVGTFGDIATFSFFGNKTITTGEGGMVVTNSKDLIQKVSKLKGQGLAGEKEYWHDVIGYNYRMTNICAAIGCAQLEKVEEIIQKKIQIGNWYQDFLKGLPLKFHVSNNDKKKHTYWMNSILLDDKNMVSGLRKSLKENSIDTRPLFPCVHKMPMYFSKENFANSEEISSRGMNLPSYPLLEKKDIEFICDKIKEFLNG